MATISSRLDTALSLLIASSASMIQNGMCSEDAARGRLTLHVGIGLACTLHIPVTCYVSILTMQVDTELISSFHKYLVSICSAIKLFRESLRMNPSVVEPKEYHCLTQALIGAVRNP